RVYPPEFIALGSVIRDFLNPDFILIGESDRASGDLIERIYQGTCENRPASARMSLVNAELTKLCLNAFLTMKISFANEVAALCEAVPGADVDAVTGAVGLDTRIGPKYLKGGLGFGGPCFPRDNQALQAAAAAFGRELRLSPKVVDVNRDVVDRLLETIVQRTPPGAGVAVLGLSYKPGTPVIEASQSLELAARLAGAGYRVNVHDPLAIQAAREFLPPGVNCRDDPYDCLRGVAGLILATPWPEYLRLDWSRARTLMTKDAYILDCWRMLKDTPPEGLEYLAPGLGGRAGRREERLGK
ncbi:MAG: nucleotide sugar dehydrogenase, partial [Thermodesulfobacteriota bacterium]